MAGVVEEQHRPLVVLGGLANSLLDPTERGEEIGGLAVEQELGIPRPDSAESGEDVVDLSSVISRVEQGAGVVAPLAVSRWWRETTRGATTPAPCSTREMTLERSTTSSPDSAESGRGIPSSCSTARPPISSPRSVGSSSEFARPPSTTSGRCCSSTTPAI